MIPSEATAQRTDEILASIRTQLEEGHIARLIDEPIETAAQEFVCPDAPARSQAELLDHAAMFLQHIHARAFPTGRQLTPAAARAEALRLLELGYPGGFRGVLLEATRQDGAGIPGMLAELRALMSHQLRESHIRWVFEYHLGRAPWSLKCQIASIVLSEWLERQAGEHSCLIAEQFANFLPQLLLYDQSIRRQSLTSLLAVGQAVP